MFAFIVFIFFSVVSQEIGWEECLLNDLFCAMCHKTLTQSINCGHCWPVSLESLKQIFGDCYGMNLTDWT